MPLRLLQATERYACCRPPGNHIYTRLGIGQSGECPCNTGPMTAAPILQTCSNARRAPKPCVAISQKPLGPTLWPCVAISQKPSGPTLWPCVAISQKPSGPTLWPCVAISQKPSGPTLGHPEGTFRPRLPSSKRLASTSRWAIDEDVEEEVPGTLIRKLGNHSYEPFCGMASRETSFNCPSQALKLHLPQGARMNGELSSSKPT